MLLSLLCLCSILGGYSTQFVSESVSAENLVEIEEDKQLVKGAYANPNGYISFGMGDLLSLQFVEDLTNYCYTDEEGMNFPFRQINVREVVEADTLDNPITLYDDVFTGNRVNGYEISYNASNHWTTSVSYVNNYDITRFERRLFSNTLQDFTITFYGSNLSQPRLRIMYDVFFDTTVGLNSGTTLVYADFLEYPHFQRWSSSQQTWQDISPYYFFVAPTSSMFGKALTYSNTLGYTDGYTEGYDIGFERGTDYGYTLGFDEGITSVGNDPQIASIFSGILEIGLLPVNFFLSILNFEVFGINIGGFVSGLLTIAIIVIIARFLFGGKND